MYIAPRTRGAGYMLHAWLAGYRVLALLAQAQTQARARAHDPAAAGRPGHRRPHWQRCCWRLALAGLLLARAIIREPR